MSDFSADDIARRFDNAKSVQAVSDIFNEVAALPAAEQKLAIDAMEQSVVKDWQISAPRGEQLMQVRMILDMVDEMQGTPEGDAMREQFEAQMPMADVGRAASISMRSIAQYKGDDTHAIIKTYLEEEAKLPGGQAQGGLDFAKLMVTTQEKLVAAEAAAAKPAARTNPFRKPGNFDL